MARRKLSNFRSSRNLNKKRLILIKVEGNNITEKQYFNNFNDTTNDYRIIMASGNTTDPISMVKALKKDMDKNGFDVDSGDKSYCVFDTDDDKLKDKQIEEALLLAKKYGIEIIISSPTFEEWLLCHFEKSTSYIKNKDILKRVNKYVSYEKNMNIYDDIKDYTKDAIINAKFKENYHKKLNHNLYGVDANPSSMIYKIVEELINK